jgi:peptidase A4-like protein
MRMFKTCVAAGATAVAAAALLASGGAPAHQAYHQPSARFLAQARGALVRYLRHSHPTLMTAHPVGRHGPRAVTLSASYNWSGYADESTKSGTFTKAAGSWTTPAATCTAEDTITSEWVGLDGATSATVEQDGTLDWCFEGTPTYFTWYEMYPKGTIEVGSTLQPGDAITASVTRSGTSYTLTLTDATNPANSFTEKASCPAATCLDTSAEWIAERSSFSIGIAPLADYGTWKLTGGTETAGGKAGTIGSYATVAEIEMVDATDTYVLSAPSPLTSAKKGFTTTWDNSY